MADISDIIINIVIIIVVIINIINNAYIIIYIIILILLLLVLTLGVSNLCGPKALVSFYEDIPHLWHIASTSSRHEKLYKLGFLLRCAVLQHFTNVF